MQININGISTNYICEGSGKTVLILPGWGAKAAVYNILIKQLSESFCVYAIDLPGFGVTPEPAEPWDVDGYADFVSEFIKTLGLDEIILVGHSYGGRIIIKLNSRKLDFSINKIILIDSAGIKHALSDEQQKRQDKYKKLKKFYSKSIVSKLFPDAQEKLQKKYGSADYSAASPVMRQCLVKAVSEDLTDSIPNISAETLLIWGRDDTATPYSDAVTMNKLIKNSELKVIDNAGHFPFIDQPFAFRQIICEYFNIP